MVEFTDYRIAVAAMALFGGLALLLGPVSALVKAEAGVVAGAAPPADYGNRAYRLHRAHQNAVENIGIFCLVTTAAILSGTAPFWVNLLASAFLLGRFAHLFIHLRGFGAPDRGLRSAVFMASWGCCMGLALLALIRLV